MSEETNQKPLRKMPDWVREKLIAINTGRVVSEETREKLRQKMQESFTPSVREKISKAIKAAHAAGKYEFLKNPQSPETRAKIGDSHRGRKLSPEVKEKIRQAVIEGHKKGKYKCKDPETWRKRLSEAHKGKVRGPNPAHSERMKGRKWSEEVIKSRALPMVGRPQTKPLVAKGTSHWASVIYKVKSPTNQIWVVHNTNHFVRAHPELFDPEDALERSFHDAKGKKHYYTRASRGLANLRSAKKPQEFWKGWTLVSDDDELYDQECLPAPTIPYTKNSPRHRDKLSKIALSKGAKHHAAAHFEVRSPKNVVWRVQNIKCFVRTHPELFDPEDVIWKRTPSGCVYCKATGGFGSLRSRKDPRGSWKGWTLVSDVEVYLNKGQDLLNRELIPEDAHVVEG